MSDDSMKAYQATPGESLERQIMNPNVPKNEREWWAAKEIEKLRALIRENWRGDYWRAVNHQQADDVRLAISPPKPSSEPTP